jgi:hypothetical protein
VLFQLKATVLCVAVILVPSSQVLAFAGPIKTDFPGVFITGTGTGAGPGSLPPHDTRNTIVNSANNKGVGFMGLLFFNYFNCFF